MLEDLGVLTDGVTKTVKDEIKKRKSGFHGALLAPLGTSLAQPVISVVKGISGRGFRRAGIGYIDKKILVLLHHFLLHPQCWDY